MASAPETVAFTGVVTKSQEDFGMVRDDVFFVKSVVKGPFPQVGDRVLVQAERVEGMPFKYVAKRLQRLVKDVTQSTEVVNSPVQPKPAYSNNPSTNVQPSLPKEIVERFFPVFSSLILSGNEISRPVEESNILTTEYEAFEASINSKDLVQENNFTLDAYNSNSNSRYSDDFPGFEERPADPKGKGKVPLELQFERRKPKPEDSWLNKNIITSDQSREDHSHLFTRRNNIVQYEGYLEEEIQHPTESTLSKRVAKPVSNLYSKVGEKLCFYCDSTDHRTRQCPKRVKKTASDLNSKDGENLCFQSDSTDRKARNCSKRQEESYEKPQKQTQDNVRASRRVERVSGKSKDARQFSNPDKNDKKQDIQDGNSSQRRKNVLNEEKLFQGTTFRSTDLSKRQKEMLSRLYCNKYGQEQCFSCGSTEHLVKKCPIHKSINEMKQQEKQSKVRASQRVERESEKSKVAGQCNKTDKKDKKQDIQDDNSQRRENVLERLFQSTDLDKRQKKTLLSRLNCNKYGQEQCFSCGSTEHLVKKCPVHKSINEMKQQDSDKRQTENVVKESTVTRHEESKATSKEVERSGADNTMDVEEEEESAQLVKEKRRSKNPLKNPVLPMKIDPNKAEKFNKINKLLGKRRLRAINLSSIPIPETQTLSLDSLFCVKCQKDGHVDKFCLSQHITKIVIPVEEAKNSNQQNVPALSGQNEVLLEKDKQTSPKSEIVLEKPISDPKITITHQEMLSIPKEYLVCSKCHKTGHIEQFCLSDRIAQHLVTTEKPIIVNTQILPPPLHHANFLQNKNNETPTDLKKTSSEPIIVNTTIMPPPLYHENILQNKNNETPTGFNKTLNNPNTQRMPPPLHHDKVLRDKYNETSTDFNKTLSKPPIIVNTKIIPPPLYHGNILQSKNNETLTDFKKTLSKPKFMHNPVPVLNIPMIPPIIDEILAGCDRNKDTEYTEEQKPSQSADQLVIQSSEIESTKLKSLNSSTSTIKWLETVQKPVNAINSHSASSHKKVETTTTVTSQKINDKSSVDYGANEKKGYNSKEDRLSQKAMEITQAVAKILRRQPPSNRTDNISTLKGDPVCYKCQKTGHNANSCGSIEKTLALENAAKNKPSSQSSPSQNSSKGISPSLKKGDPVIQHSLINSKSVSPASHKKVIPVTNQKPDNSNPQNSNAQKNSPSLIKNQINKNQEETPTESKNEKQLLGPPTSTYVPKSKHVAKQSAVSSSVQKEETSKQDTSVIEPKIINPPVNSPLVSQSPTSNKGDSLTESKKICEKQQPKPLPSICVSKPDANAKVNPAKLGKSVEEPKSQNQNSDKFINKYNDSFIKINSSPNSQGQVSPKKPNEALNESKKEQQSFSPSSSSSPTTDIVQSKDSDCLDIQKNEQVTKLKIQKFKNSIQKFRFSLEDSKIKSSLISSSSLSQDQISHEDGLSMPSYLKKNSENPFSNTQSSIGDSKIQSTSKDIPISAKPSLDTNRFRSAEYKLRPASTTEVSNKEEKQPEFKKRRLDPQGLHIPQSNRATDIHRTPQGVPVCYKCQKAGHIAKHCESEGKSEIKSIMKLNVSQPNSKSSSQSNDIPQKSKEDARFKEQKTSRTPWESSNAPQSKCQGCVSMMLGGTPRDHQSNCLLGKNPRFSGKRNQDEISRVPYSCDDQDNYDNRHKKCRYDRHDKLENRHRKFNSNDADQYDMDRRQFGVTDHPDKYQNSHMQFNCNDQDNYENDFNPPYEGYLQEERPHLTDTLSKSAAKFLSNLHSIDGEKLCFHCDSTDHVARNCLKHGAETANLHSKYGECFHCGSTDHKARKCPNRQKTSYESRKNERYPTFHENEDNYDNERESTFQGYPMEEDIHMSHGAPDNYENNFHCPIGNDRPIFHQNKWPEGGSRDSMFETGRRSPVRLIARNKEDIPTARRENRLRLPPRKPREPEFPETFDHSAGFEEFYPKLSDFTESFDGPSNYYNEECDSQLFDRHSDYHGGHSGPQVCSYCHKKGHVTEECWHYLKRVNS